MLIVCPSCATSYMIEAASLGVGGRMVRCARCKATWFAGGGEEQVSAFVDDVIAEAEAESPPPQPFLRAPPGPSSPAPSVHFGDQPPTPDFGASPAEQSFGAPADRPAAYSAPGFAPETAPDLAPDPQAAAARREWPAQDAVHDAPSLVPPMEHPPADEIEHDSDDVESYAARRQRLRSRRKQAKRSSRWTAVILVLLAFNVALIGGRSEIVRYMPQTASLFAAIGLPVNLQQLKFENVSITPNSAGGEGLTVTGAIVSIADKPVKVPALRFAARNAAGQEVYTWTTMPTRPTLEPGERLNFRSELNSPPPDAKDVLVRFVTAEEAAKLPPSMTKPGPGQSQRNP